MKPKNEYQTSTGKIEFYATKAEKLGLTSLPKQYPLPKNEGFILLNTAVKKYTHTQFQDVYGRIPSTVFIHPEDAENYEVHEGDTVELYNELGA
ncbi:MAG: molybdopterin dinucleotide binding domain-containing protein [Candidatus Bathyarchaeia archaeon]|nr:molybdopterin dinucleotide binding domain-containing protein [Candidatus Bathyarchaeia archaeon]